MNTKDKIVKSAFDVFMLKGYNGTSISDLVATTGLSKGAFYHHFDSKEKLYFSVIDTFFLRHFTGVDWSTTESLTFQEFELLLRDYFNKFIIELRLITQNQLSRYYVLFFEAFEYHPSFKDEIQEFYTQLKNIIDAKCKLNNQEPKGLKLITELEGFLFWNAVFPDKMNN